MKIIEVVAASGHLDTIKGVAEQQQVVDYRLGAEDADGRRVVRLLVADEQAQPVLDAMEGCLAGDASARIVVLPVEATYPRQTLSEEEAERARARSVATTREELYDSIEKNARLDRTYVVLVFLSTVVAAIGLIEDNVAVVIGAMVIAPLLGPNLALSLGAALGDAALMGRSLRTNLAGTGIALALSVTVGFFWPLGVVSRELLARTDVGLDSVALALASGAAAVLSLTTRLPTILVGVMVAVALLPPTATLGLMLGSGQLVYAWGAGLLLAVNVVCVNLSANLVFLLQGVRPRTWWEREKARQSLTVNLVIWAASLAILIVAIYLRQRLLAHP